MQFNLLEALTNRRQILYHVQILDICLNEVITDSDRWESFEKLVNLTLMAH